MVSSPFPSSRLVGRQQELAQVSQILLSDRDLLLAGVPGIGRRTLIRTAARNCGAKVLEIDCLRATNYSRFLQLLAEAILSTYETPEEIRFIDRWSKEQPFILRSTNGRPQLTWHSAPGKESMLFEALLTLPQALAEWSNSRVVIVFLNFPHLRSFDRANKWEQYLRQEVERQSRVSYALIATVAERWSESNHLPIVALSPVSNSTMQAWISETMLAEGLEFEPESLLLFLNYVQGHFGDAITLARRVWLEYGKRENHELLTIVQPHQVERSAIALIEDLSVTFESLILLLPHSQVRVLESLALDPTDSPHAREYIQKHNLSRGGGLQGALASLEQKGLVYGAELGYRIALPLLGAWLKHRLS
ncbi:ATP-binding protein [Leptolyngbya sp. NIES-2104]|uniref:ATP-binding protein n=1 Tax=Leptolyngbya sp. NIES-2104 TaxID=1552121 RepID=UPI00073E1390|nr:ATP-binding protein [Leptolyngbya sp. NIES-2104]